MFGMIKRMFGMAEQPVINSDPFGREKRMAPVAALQPRPQAAAGPVVVLQRDEVIDCKTHIAGYRFDTKLPVSTEKLSEQARFEALRDARLAAFAERRLVLVPLAAQQWFRQEYRALIGPRTVFLLDASPEDAEALARWRTVAQSIRDAGARVALRGSEMARESNLVELCADLLVLDFPSYSLPNFERLTARLRRELPKLQLIADCVSSWAERRYCASRGVDYCIGPFTTSNDDEQNSKEIGQGRLVLIEMLNLVRNDADMEEITQVAKHDPGVVVKIMAMANSPLLGVSRHISSFDQAVMVLGRDQLYRWLSIGLFRAGKDSPRDEVLLELALNRGRLLELLGSAHHVKTVCDELFLLGLLSLLDTMIGVPMAELLKRLNLSSEISDVLLHSEGPFARYLSLAIAVEKGQAAGVARLAGELDIGEADLAAASLEAMRWTEEALRYGK